MFMMLSFFLSAVIHAGCITSEGVSLRGDAGKKAQISWKVRKYTPLKKIGEPKDGWVQVKDMEGDRHWVKQRFFTEKYHCVMVKNSNVHIKVGPGDRYNRKFKEPAQKYETFRFIKAKKGWIKIKDIYGDTGWVRYSDVWVD